MACTSRGFALSAALSLLLGLTASSDTAFAGAQAAAQNSSGAPAGPIQTSPRVPDKIANDGDNVDAGAKQYVIANKGSRVFAGRESFVVANDGSYVEASNGAIVIANYGARVDAYEGSKVYARAGSHIVAAPGAEVIADPGAIVENEID